MISRVRTGKRGRPKVVIEAEFLQVAHGLRNVSSIARYLGCSRTVVQAALLNAGLKQPGQNPFPGRIRGRHLDVRPAPAPLSIHFPSTNSGPNIPPPMMATSSTTTPQFTPPAINVAPPGFPVSPPAPPLRSPFRDAPYAGRYSTWTDRELDEAIARLRVHFPQAGIAMLEGLLLRLGHRVSRCRIRRALIRVEPIRRVFQRPRIERRKYSVPGPNALWHHDGQHGE